MGYSICRKLCLPLHEQSSISTSYSGKNFLRYLKGTIDHDIFFPANDTGELSIFTDADWAGEIDSRRSTSGILYKLGSSPIAWSSKLQPTLALSSIEAEYRVLSEAARNITYFRRLLDELKIGNSSPTPIFCDNLSSIKLVRNPVMHQRTKHIELEHHYIREKYDDGTIVITYVPTHSQQADLLTKPLASNQFITNRDLTGLRPVPKH